MKPHAVDWWKAADEELLRLWLDTPSLRLEISSASHEINRLLAAQAESIGEEVHEGLRKLEIAPLRVQFSVESEDRKVRVWTVRLTDR